jgi:diphthine synthase
MLYLIGIGLWDEKDISVKAKEIICRTKTRVYLETYTSKLSVSREELEKTYEKPIKLLDREGIEQGSSELIEKAKDMDIAILIVGDALSATTHISLIQEAKEKGVKFEIINNASVLTAVSITGLELYKYGQTTSIPFDNPDLETPYNVIKNNQSLGLHTLLLLDLNPEEDRFMTVKEAIHILSQIEGRKEEKVFTSETLCVGCARLGGDYKIVAGTADKVKEVDFGGPLHCLIVPGKLHFVEEEMLRLWK